MTSSETMDHLLWRSINGKNRITLINRSYCLNTFGTAYRAKIVQALSELQNDAYVFDGATTTIDQFQTVVNDQSFSDQELEKTRSPYKRLKRVMEQQGSAVIVVFRAHQIDKDFAHLLDRLGQHAKRKQFGWNFILIGRKHEFLNKFPRHFYSIQHLPPESKESAPKTRSDSFVYKLGFNALILVIAAVVYFSFQQPPRPAKESSTVRLETLSEVSGQSVELEAYDYSNIGFEGERDFQNRLNEWQSASQSNLEAQKDSSSSTTETRVENREDSRANSVAMSDVIERAFDQGDINTLLEWYANENINAVDAKGHSALIKSLSLVNTNLTEFLISKGANINRADSYGKTPLLHASIMGNHKAVEVLLTHDAEPNKRSEFLKTPLMAAAHNGHEDIVSLLLAHGAKPNLKDHSGWTALFYAVWNSEDQIEDLLISRGASDKIKDDQGVDIYQLKSLRPAEN